jgi:hypothetical protein
MTHNTPHHERLDEATRRRLFRLSGKPVDTTRLEARLNKAIESRRTPRPVPRPAVIRRWASVSRIAAVVAVTGLLVGLLFTSMAGNPAIASTTDLARVHREVSSGKSDLVAATNVAEATGNLQRLWSGMPSLPEPTVGQITATCLHNVADRDVACLRLEFKGRPITMVVGHSREIVCSAEHRQVSLDGRTYMVHDRDGVRMVMITRQGRWVCLMGDLDVDELMQVADGLRF